MDSSQVVRRFYDIVWTGGKLDRAPDFIDPDLLDHDPLPFPGRAPGAEGLMQVVGMIRAAIPDLTRTVVQQVVQGDLVATRFNDTGTHLGEFMGIPATGKVVSVGGMNIERLREGRIAEVWHVEDLHGLLQQLGGTS